ncbi:methyltransferase domain-containing protein, partial [Streptomyces albidoflavus]|uniref:methyltransferase domain-containing protein n=1 Tax=Streptomyces albidoflavus TaxID=1886 RepID=UPI0038D0A528
HDSDLPYVSVPRLFIATAIQCVVAGLPSSSPAAARTGALDAVFAAGMVSHLADPVAGVREWARVVRPGGTLALFHPLGRAALAARQGRTLTPDDVRAEGPVTALLEAGGWRVRSYADEPDRYLVLAGRTG